jgi:hypothetical protein
MGAAKNTRNLHIFIHRGHEVLRVGEDSRQAKQESNRSWRRYKRYIGLILKCNEIREKTKHYGEARTRNVERGAESGRDDDTHPQILHQVVKYTQALWVLTILNIHQRPNFCSLKAKRKR